jgi:hypothetical protein
VVRGFEFLEKDYEEPVPKDFGRLHNNVAKKDPEMPVPKDFGRSYVSSLFRYCTNPSRGFIEPIANNQPPNYFLNENQADCIIKPYICKKQK